MSGDKDWRDHLTFKRSPAPEPAAYHPVFRHEWSGAEAAMLERLPSHLPEESGKCACGFDAWTLEHVVVAVWREGGLQEERIAAAKAHARGIAQGMARPRP